jgi:hypothetical protein
MNRFYSLRIAIVLLSFISISLFNVKILFDSNQSFDHASVTSASVIAQELAPIDAFPCTGSTCKSVPGGSGLESWYSTDVDGRLQVVCCTKPAAFPGSTKKVE